MQMGKYTGGITIFIHQMFITKIHGETDNKITIFTRLIKKYILIHEIIIIKRYIYNHVCILCFRICYPFFIFNR